MWFKLENIYSDKHFKSYGIKNKMRKVSLTNELHPLSLHTVPKVDLSMSTWEFRVESCRPHVSAVFSKTTKTKMTHIWSPAFPEDIDLRPLLEDSLPTKPLSHSRFCLNFRWFTHFLMVCKQICIPTFWIIPVTCTDPHTHKGNYGDDIQLCRGWRLVSAGGQRG